MSVSTIARNLRNGQLKIVDGTGTPQSLTLKIDQGDLTWVEKNNTIEVLDRGSITDGHLRKGEEASIQFSFTARWNQFIGKSADATDPLQLYEFLMFASGANIVSTSESGEQDTLQFEFTILDPAGVASEKVTFQKVYRESLTLSEEADFNLISFSGKDFETTPTIVRV